MTEQSRIDLIESFVTDQPYLKGVQYRVLLYDNAPVIEFKEITQSQIFKVKHALRQAELLHIKINPLEVTEDPAQVVPTQRQGRRKRRYSRP